MFIKCYINKIYHYKNVITYQIENRHIVLKSNLRILTSNFLIIVTNINFLL